MLKEVAQELEELSVGVMSITFLNERLRSNEHVGLNDGCESPILPRPLGGRVARTRGLEFGAGTVVEIIADILLVDEELMDGAAGPRPTKISQDCTLVEAVRNLTFGLALFNELAVNILDDPDLGIWTRHQDNAIGRDAFMLTPAECPLGFACLINQ